MSTKAAKIIQVFLFRQIIRYHSTQHRIDMKLPLIQSLYWKTKVRRGDEMNNGKIRVLHNSVLARASERIFIIRVLNPPSLLPLLLIIPNVGCRKGNSKESFCTPLPPDSLVSAAVDEFAPSCICTRRIENWPPWLPLSSIYGSLSLFLRGLCFRSFLVCFMYARASPSAVDLARSFFFTVIFFGRFGGVSGDARLVLKRFTFRTR